MNDDWYSKYGDKFNDTVKFRPSTEDRRIIDRIMHKLADLTGLESMNKAHTAAIRHALRFWDKNNREEE